jgi:hypothetical protein
MMVINHDVISAVEKAFDWLMRPVTTAFRTRLAVVSLVDSNMQFFKNQFGMSGPPASTRQTPLTHSFCQHAATSRKPLIVPDAWDPTFDDETSVSALNVIPPHEDFTHRLRRTWSGLVLRRGRSPLGKRNWSIGWLQY